ncbi:zona pellucida sperm-binding protein 3-like [Ambystoma mexicanum]|uniref:zona pellucida sperm-binding protein 3-like n=1 Tax=Ambystoma mexicanum TaxID=8296 RepID=UPI0037E749CC
MRQAVGIVRAVLLCLVMAEGVASSPWWDPSSRRGSSSWAPQGSRASAPGVSLTGTWSQAGSRALPPMTPLAVQCQEAAMVVTVQRDLFGTGKLVQAADLRLGADFCSYTSANADNTVTFLVTLQDCGNTLQVTPDLLVYSSILTYSPSPSTSSSRVITRTSPAAVLVQCIYPRNVNVSSQAIKPTWIPYSSTVSAEESLAFSLRLMSSDWSAPRPNSIFQLGDVFNIEASVQPGNHVAMTVYVDGCVATLTPDQTSSPRYDIIASHGCLVDGKLSDSASSFISPRPQPSRLQFTVDAFRFIGDDRHVIYITCSLKAVPVGSEQGAVDKACSFSKSSNSYVALEGSSSICSCCDSGNCVAAPRGKRDVSKPGLLPVESEVAVIGPLTILGELTSKRAVPEQSDFLDLSPPGSEHSPGLVLALLVISSVFLAVAALGSILLVKKCRDGQQKPCHYRMESLS